MKKIKARQAPLPASARVAKPPYRVMSMEQIRAQEPNGFKVASTFSGGGGSSTGYRMAGFQVVYANEFVEAGRESYRANMAPYTKLDGRDIRTVTAESILEMTGLRQGELDLFDGSPPCSAFSTAGKREAGWGSAKKYSDDKVQRVDDLFFEYARLLEGLQPKTFVAENVSGLVKGTAKGYFLQILARLKACGYRVEAKVLDASWLGVPQARQRLIFVGVREDLGLAPSFPTPLPYRYSVRDALPWIGGLSFTTGGQNQAISPLRSVNDPIQIITSGNANNFTVEAEADITRYAIGDEWDNIRPGQQSERFFSLVKPHPDAPSPCITASAGSTSTAGVVHPYEKRKFSIAELRRICGFPDDFVLQGSYAQQWERCGRAVPPVMMMHIAAAVRDKVLRRL